MSSTIRQQAILDIDKVIVDPQTITRDVLSSFIYEEFGVSVILPKFSRVFCTSHSLSLLACIFNSLCFFYSYWDFIGREIPYMLIS